jgi:hypothetical protein
METPNGLGAMFFFESAACGNRRQDQPSADIPTESWHEVLKQASELGVH